ncbi:hypothetical protein TrRE_jg4260, partial [Triparma retinervis]
LNLHDVTLLSTSFSDLCKENDIKLMAAAPLSMGLLTPGDPPSWHPAPAELKERCKRATTLCEEANVSLPHLATIYALAIEEIPCTLLGVKNSLELERMLQASRSLKEVEGFAFNGDVEGLPLTPTEVKVLQALIGRRDIFGGIVRDTGWKEV